MKKLVCLAFIAIMSTVKLCAQERDSGEIELIPYMGYTGSFLNGDHLNELLEPKSSFRFGANVDYYLNDRWSLRSGLNYDTQGVESNGRKLNLNYITAPLNINWHFGSTRKWNLNFGFSAGILASAKYDGVKINDGIKSFQLAISSGIGYKFEVSRNFNLMLDIQNQFGITNYLESDMLKRTNVASSFNIGGVFLL